MRLASRFLTPLKISARSVQLEIKTALNAVHLDHLLSSLTEHFKPNVLESLDVQDSRPGRAEFHNYALSPLTASAFQRLRAFTGLTRLNLGSMYISITDDEVLGLISTWPQIEEFYLGTTWDWGALRFGVTFRGLGGILERCPNLRLLRVNLDTSAPHDLPVYVDHRYIGITREKVTFLGVGYAECNVVEAIGNLLGAMCPNLRQIDRACLLSLVHESDVFYDKWPKR
ncbi:uncharacterized protein EDB91DRAFT_235904 [Suillus paluster]|uniref:uncharacterized protein n=1 Tax=Suillus paluster TaxID=48578 RepID=UPI001B8600F9|nr:uncharacterized protein EDB91DRAFT_235904 [Suillus paluster]KAG1743226.1 hypothetical protein EDB91DRAFT_235904 [Suillus paluster]